MVAQCPALYPESQTVNNMVSKILLLGKSSSQRQSSSGPGEAAVDARTRCRVGWKREESPSLLSSCFLVNQTDTPLQVSSAHISRFNLLGSRN